MSRKIIDVLIFVVCLFVVVLVFHVFSNQLIGSGDSWQFIWSFWFFKKSLIEGKSIFFTDYLFYPKGTTLYFHNFSFLNSFISLILSTFIDEYFLIYNIIIIINFALNAFSIYLLIKDLTRNTLLSFLFGIFFTFNPFIMGHLLPGHIDLITVWPTIFYFKYLFSLKKSKRPIFRDVLFLSFFMLLASFACWYNLIYLTLFHFTFLLFNIRDKKIIKKLLVSYIIAIIFILPVLSRMMWEMLTSKNKYYDVGEEIVLINSLDLLSFFVPSYNNPILSSYFSFIFKNFTGHFSENIGFLGFSLLSLTLISLKVVKRNSTEIKFIYFMLLVSILLSLGPKLHVNGKELDVYLPYILIRKLVPPLRSPSRVIIFAHISTFVISSLSLSQLLKKINQFYKYVTYLLLILVLYIEFYSTIMLSDPKVSSFYLQLKNIKEKIAVTDIPFGPKVMYYAIFHDKPITSGYTSRLESDIWRENKIIDVLYSDMFKDTEMDLKFSNEEINQLKEVKISYIVLHVNWVSNPNVAIKNLIQLANITGGKIEIYPDGPIDDGIIYVLSLNY